MKTILTAPLYCGLAVSMILPHAGCRSADSGSKKSESAPQARNPLEVTIKQTVISQIKTGEPVLAEVSGSLRVPGRVEADETRVTRVGSPVTGRITELDVLER